MSQGELFSLAGVSPAELWVPHLLRVLLEGDANIPVATTDTLIDCDQTCLISYHSLVLALSPTKMGGILLVHLPKEENDEGDKKGAGTNEHNVHRSLLSEEKLSSK